MKTQRRPDYSLVGCAAVAWTTIVVCIVLCCSLLTCCTVVQPMAVTSNPVGTLTGESSAVRVFGLWADPGGGIAEATKAAGIVNVSSVDVRTTNVLGVYVKVTTIVTGYR